MQNLVTIGRSATELLCIFDFQNGGRPPSWIWYDVTSDHPRLVFDGPNILLKLHVDRVYTLQDIAILRDVVSAVYATATWLAGRVSVTPRYCIKTAKPILKLFDHLVATSF